MPSTFDDSKTDAPTPFRPPETGLPKGGGAIRGMGEKFAANPATGTATLTVPLPLSPGRDGFGPRSQLKYDSGSGNGPFGIGFAADLPEITRKTSKGVPVYDDAAESDVFLLSDAEDLVPCLARAGDDWVAVECEREGHAVKSYRPRVEGLFAVIERWTRLRDGDVHWRSIGRDNVLTVYGDGPDSRIADPDDPRRVFSWLIASSRDDRGNAVAYEYAPEDESGVDLTRPSERRRSSRANRYLKRILYGNRTPWPRDPAAPRPGVGWLFEMVFDYGDEPYRELRTDGLVLFGGDNGEPYPSWPVRPDSFSVHRSGFEVRTHRLCRRALMFHRFPDELGEGRQLVRSCEFEYRLRPTGSTLARVVCSGYSPREGGLYLKRSMPPLDLWFTTSPLDDPKFRGFRLEEPSPEGVKDLRGGIDAARDRWIDMDGEGIEGLLRDDGVAWLYKRNLGGGRLAPASLVCRKPTTAALGSGRQEFVDVEGDGLPDMVDFGLFGAPGFHGRDADAGWVAFRPFAEAPVLDWRDPNLRMVDVTGDGLADLLVTCDDGLTWHESLGRGGFGRAVRSPSPPDEEDGPRILFADAEQAVSLADLSGDGLSDIVRVRDGEVCYWPNLGYGRFGPKVTMDAPPRLDSPGLFDPSRVRFADTDGSGTADLLYFGRDGVRVFLNESGNGWSGPRAVEAFPRLTPGATVAVVDLLGRGTACLVWSTTNPADERRPLRYVDLMCGRKPRLLEGVANNLGAETRITYASSTEFSLADRAEGRPWLTRLPFPVQVVARVETLDRIVGHRFATRYAYHHGFYDGREREYRGFGLVEQFDGEAFGVDWPEGAALPARDDAFDMPPVLTKTWFHTGAAASSRCASLQFEGEYYREPGGGRGPGLGDSELPDFLSIEEEREAYRALKGAVLRREVYALDGSDAAARPYTVSESNYVVRLLQPRGRNRHAVFFTHESESLGLQYERALYPVGGRLTADPRVSHRMTLDVDDYGNVLRAVNVAYGRLLRDHAPWLSEADWAIQSRPLLTLEENGYTAPVRLADAWRTPLPAFSSRYEVILDGTEDRTRRSLRPIPPRDLRRIVGRSPLRLLSRSRTLYRADDMRGLLPLGATETLALPGEQYRLAFTPERLASIYGDKIPKPEEVLGGDGGYVRLDGDGCWWTRSGRVFYHPDPDADPARERARAVAHFFRAERYRDPFGNSTVVEYDRHDLLPVERKDAAGNVARLENDYRVLSPHLATDANGNRSRVAFDALGMVVGTAVMGKRGGHEGDSLDGFIADLDEATQLAHLHDPLRDLMAIVGHAGTRLIYDLFAYMRDRSPATAYVLARETHASDLRPGELTEFQHSFAYSDGFGREIQTKARAEGDAHGPRWRGTGWTIFNNRGKPVRRFEPFFSRTHRFEPGTIEGVSSTLLYDPIGRVVATLHPDHTFEKTTFDPWRQETWDVNDTALIADPTADPDVGPFLRRLPRRDFLPTWYEKRIDGGLGPAERLAAERVERHAGTPTVAHGDPLGRAFLVVAHNRDGRPDRTDEGRYRSFVDLDIEGRTRSAIDALGRTIMAYEYDLMGNQTYQDGADGGRRWALPDGAGQPFLAWDGRGHRVRRRYDVLRRPTGLFVSTYDSPERLAEETVYGEGRANAEASNLRGKVYQQRDAAGIVATDLYDFKGNPLRSERRLLEDYKGEADWSRPSTLQDEAFLASSEFDALNRPTAMTAPDLSVLRPGYNEAGLLERIGVRLKGADEATPFVVNIDYNAKGQRAQIAYGNGVRTSMAYDPETFRLRRLRTVRPDDDAVLQDLRYAYDPAGHVVSVADSARPTVYFRNQAVDPGNDYIYDAIYRLVRATGREHAGGPTGPETPSGDDPRSNDTLPGDGQALRRYREDYEYDPVDNLLALVHSAHHGSWTRSYDYAEIDTNNRLTSTSVGSIEAEYAYDPHGNMTRMGHLPHLAWNYKDQLHATRRQEAGDGHGGTTYYVYDSTGRRVRKVTEGRDGSALRERIDLGGFEVYREYRAGSVSLQRDTLHVMDGDKRVALVETVGDESAIRYQLGDHLDSAVLELDERGAIVTFEEYYPYGATSYRSGRSASEVGRKRYRFTGKERDDETGLDYHGARYYASWLGRWTSSDPIGIKDGPNTYAYARDNPVNLTDPGGTECNSAVATCVEPPVNTSLEAASQTSDPNLRAVDEINEENAKALGALRQGQVVPSTYSGADLNADVAKAVKQANSPEYKLAAAIAQAEHKRQEDQAAEAKEEAETQKELPGTLGSITPIYGSGKSSYVHFKHGNYVRGVLYGALAISDVFLVKSLVVGAGKLAIRGIGALAADATVEAVNVGAHATADAANVGVHGAAEATAAGGGASRTIALDANAFRNLKTLKTTGVVDAGDILLVTPNVQIELARHGISAADLAKAGVTAVGESPVGASVAATRIADILRSVPAAKGAASALPDALNLGEAAGVGVDAFITQDRHVLRFFGGTSVLPGTNGVSIRVIGF